MTPRRPATALPPPDPAAAALSERLQARITEAIEAVGGALRFDHYMRMALYEPGLGYYSAGLPRFGAAGDFTTAPLVSPLFARTLARQCAAVLEAIGDGEILELGAGTGRMAADLLSELAALDRLPGRYRILEVSGALREEQRDTLTAADPELARRVEWLDRLPESGLRGVILANEVMDALPVRRFRRAGERLRELMVTAGGDGGFAWAERPADAAVVEAVTAIEADVGAFADGYLSEWCPLLGPWVAALADAIVEGVALLIDYGYPRREYYHPDRRMGTLMCHYRHRAHDDPLVLPGLQDISAFVDFTAAARAGSEAGLDRLGYATQGHFLMGAGLPALLEEAAAGDPNRAAALAQQAKTLMFPDGMGERFKVLALGRGVTGGLAGFSLFDRRDRL